MTISLLAIVLKSHLIATVLPFVDQWLTCLILILFPFLDENTVILDWFANISENLLSFEAK
jgi:hypothetical protein